MSPLLKHKTLLHRYWEEKSFIIFLFLKGSFQKEVDREKIPNIDDVPVSCCSSWDTLFPSWWSRPRDQNIQKNFYENYRRRRNLGWEWKLSHGDLSGQWIQRTQVWILLGAGLLYFFFFPLNKKSGYAQNLDRSFANFLVGAMESIRSGSTSPKPSSWLRSVNY